jgi:hypothetical protein
MYLNSSAIFRFSAMLILCLIVATPQAHGQTPARDYPGIGHDGGIHYVALRQVQDAVLSYYKVFARWPDNWQAVRDAGIFQVTLRGFDMSELDPDEQAITGTGDVYYEFNRNANRATVYAGLISGGTFTIKSFQLMPPDSYLSTFQQFDKLGAEAGYEGPTLSSLYAQREDKLRQFAILSQMEVSLRNFRDVRGDYPHTIAQFLNSGLGPIDGNSINPVTGQKFRFDGSADDVFYRYVSEKIYHFKHLDDNLQETPYFTY